MYTAVCTKLSKMTQLIFQVSFKIIEFMHILGWLLHQLLTFSTQVFGRFPFDDTNHKVLLKQVPERDWVSAECKNLLDKIFQPIKTRYTVEEIKRDKWFQRVGGGSNSAGNS